jgi:hypothetical protein
MGENDAAQCIGPWLPATLGHPGFRALASLSEPGGVRLRTAADASVVGVELYVPRWWPASYSTLRLTALDGLVGYSPEFAPYIDVGFRVRPGAWHTLEFPLPSPDFPLSPVLAGAEVHIYLAVDPPAAAWPGRRFLQTQLTPRVRGVWLRGARLEHRDVTIVVLNWNRPQDTIACLESLAAADLRGASVLVVDNGSRDGSVAAIRQRFPDQRIVELPENRGYSGGNNAGIRAALEAGAKGVLVLNNDTRVAPDFLEPLLWVLNSDCKAAAVSSGVLRSDYPDMAVLESAYLQIYWGHGIILHYGVNALPNEGFNYRREVEVVVGCSVLFSAEALREIGMLDESYFAYHEEVDWCLRARAAGYRNYWQPYSRVWHTKSTSTSALAPALAGERTKMSGPQLPGSVPLPWNPVQTYLGARNSVRFIRRHANLRQTIYFVLSSLYAVPLEFLAAVMRQEAALKIGAWGYRKALSLYCANPYGADDPPPVSALTKLLRLPVVLFRALPRDIRAARREGRLAQVREQVRGLWDGICDRPLPLERLGLR